MRRALLGNAPPSSREYQGLDLAERDVAGGADLQPALASHVRARHFL